MNFPEISMEQGQTKSISDPAQIAIIEYAMEAISSLSCITYRRIYNQFSDPDFLYFIKDVGYV